MLAVTGYNSKIVQELIQLLPEGEEIIPLARKDAEWNGDCNKFLLCAGVLHSKPYIDQSPFEVGASLETNMLRPLRLCENIINLKDSARICIIGSESGFSWSYDDIYAAAKSALHRYVETKKLKPNQQLVCVAPSIIGDAGMTLRREDTKNLERRREEHPKKRFLTSLEVAKMVHHLLYVDEGYTTGTVIRMNGGGR
jgi:NAD(P)-dependent dehydrogenase (short-subunit alcohol dehydrogenase family)